MDRSRNETSGGCGRAAITGGALLLAVVLLFVATPISGVRTARAAAAIEIEATASTAPTFWLDDVTFDVVVTNAGSEPLTDVLVDVYLDGAQLERIDGVITGPIVPAGNGDDVLDVGEAWTYHANAPASSLQFRVSAMEAGASTVEAEAWVTFGAYPGALAQPVAVTFESEPDPPAAGVSVLWTITVTSRIDPDLVIDSGDHRLVFPGAPPARQPLGTPVDQGDGDDVISRDESWRWEVTYPVEVDGSALELDLRYRLPGFVGGFQITGLRSDEAPEPVPTTTTLVEVTTTVAPTTTPGAEPAVGATLPETGSSTRSVVAAALLVAGGALLVAVARRRPGRDRADVSI